jgi:hypothetical protein
VVGAMKQFEPSTDEPPPLFRVRIPLRSYETGVPGVEISGHVRPDGGAELRARYCAYSVVSFTQEALNSSPNMAEAMAAAVPRLVRDLLDFAAKDASEKFKASR